MARHYFKSAETVLFAQSFSTNLKNSIRKDAYRQIQNSHTYRQEPSGEHEQCFNAWTINNVAIVFVGQEQYNCSDIIIQRWRKIFCGFQKHIIHMTLCSILLSSGRARMATTLTSFKQVPIQKTVLIKRSLYQLLCALHHDVRGIVKLHLKIPPALSSMYCGLCIKVESRASS